MDINNNILFYFLILSIIINFLVINFSVPISEKLKLIDKPDKKRKYHTKKTPLIASLPIVILLFATIIYDYFYNFIENKDFIIIFISSIFVYIVGLFDDRIDLSPLIKIILISIISYLAITNSNNLLITKFYISTYDTFLLTKYFAIFFTILCLLTLTNVLNLIDGIDGLAIGVLIIWFLFYLMLFNYQFEYFNDFKLKIFFLIIILNLLVIFIFNIRGHYFLGDSGSLFLSFLFGMIIIKSINENYIPEVSYYISAEQILILFIIPFLDMLRVMISRIINEKNPFSGDRNHLHHHILSYVNNKKKTIWIYFVIVLIPILSSYFFKNIKIELIIIFTIFLYMILVKYIYNKKKTDYKY